MGNSSTGNATGRIATATITIGAEPTMVFSSSQLGRVSPFQAMLQDAFRPSFSRMSSSSSSHPFFMESSSAGMMPLRSPLFGPTFGSTVSSARPFNLMSGMFMKAQHVPEAADSTVIDSMSNDVESGKVDSNKNDTLSAQASQLINNSSSVVPATKSTNDANEIEMLDVSHLPRSFSRVRSSFRSPLVHPSSGMLIFGNPMSNFVDDNQRASEFSPFPPVPPPFGLFSSFMPSFRPPPPPMMMQPQMMLMADEGQQVRSSANSAMMNPILKTILNNVISDIADASSLSTAASNGRSKNKTAQRERDSHDRRASHSVPSWSPSSSGVSADMMDDEWPTDSSPNSDNNNNKWDEREQSAGKQPLRAKHRMADVDDVEDNSRMDSSPGEFGLQLDQTSPFASILDRGQLESSGLISGTIQQTIRGPESFSMERIIDIPSGRVVKEQVGPGIRSQSISRADVESAESAGELSSSREPSSASSRSALFSSRPIDVLSSLSNEAADAPPHIGFIGQLLSDLSRRSSDHHHQPHFLPGPLSRHRSIDIDDLDEGDSDGDSGDYSNNNSVSPPRQTSTWPKVRVASARVRMRPIAPEPRLDGDFSAGRSESSLVPTHFTIPAGDSSQDGGDKETANSNQQQAAEATSGHSSMNNLTKPKSMTDHNLLHASSGLSAINHRQLQHKVKISPDPESRLSSAAGTSKTPSIASRRSATEQVNQLPFINHQESQRSGNPFTSPTSPLFGFPTSSLAVAPRLPGETSSKHPPQPITQSQQQQQRLVVPGANRQQRSSSFTYHSNNELASTFADKQQQQHDSTVRARQMPSFIPASIVMGRRLDDGPMAFNPEQPMNNHHEEQSARYR